VELARWASWAARAGRGGGSVLWSCESEDAVSSRFKSTRWQQTDILRAEHVAQRVHLVDHHSSAVYQAHALRGRAGVHGILDADTELLDRRRGRKVG
jgi:hypothetical protein